MRFAFVFSISVFICWNYKFHQKLLFVSLYKGILRQHEIVTAARKMRGGDRMDDDTSSLNSIQSRSISQAVIDHYKEKLLEMEPEVCVCVSSWKTVLGSRLGRKICSVLLLLLFYSLGWVGLGGDQNLNIQN